MALIGSAAIWPGHILTRINVRTVFEIAVTVVFEMQIAAILYDYKRHCKKLKLRLSIQAFKHYIESFGRIELTA